MAFVLLKAYYHKLDAEMMVGLLKNNGIEAILQSDDAGGFYPHLTLGMGNNRVLVHEKDSQKALEVIKTISGDLSDEELKQIEEVAINAKEPGVFKNNNRLANNVPIIVLIVLIIVFLFIWTHSSVG